MELSFAFDNSADASLLAQELEETLRAQGISPNAISLKPASPENMDIGSVVWVAIERTGQVVEAAGTVLTIAKCVYDVANKYGVGVIFTRPEGKVEVPATTVAMNLIEQILSDSSQPRVALRS